MKKISLILLTVLGLSIHSFAQDTTVVYEPNKPTAADEKRAQYTSSLMISPFYAALNGLRLDVELRTGNDAIVIAPVVYIHNNPGNTWEDYDEMIGAGLDLAYKLNLRNANKFFVPYAALGLSYDWYMLTVNGDNFYKDEYIFYDDVYNQDIPYPYYRTPIYFEGKKDINIHKVGLDAMMGVQLSPIPRFVVDFSIGVGGRYAIVANEKEIIKDKFSSDIISVGYSGIVPACNLKFGLKF